VSHTRRLFAAAALFAASATTFLAGAHPDIDEPGLLAHFGVATHELKDGKVEDATHNFTATVQGKPRHVTIGPSQGWAFNGGSDWLLVAPDAASVQAKLPKKEMTVAAWVNLRETTEDGSMVSIIQDDGSKERGWVLGYNKNSFHFGLSTVGANEKDREKDGQLTYVRAKTPIAKGRWYHVVGTYDGTTMKIFVNGKLEGESKDQSGDILYPPAGYDGPFTIGAYKDANEIHPLDGALHRIKLYNVVVPEAEIVAVVAKNKNMVDYDPSSADSMQFLVKPYLQFATKDSIVIMSESSKPSKMRVEYATKQPLDKSGEQTEFKEMGEVALTGLDPQTTYFYRVIRTAENGEELWSDIYSFQTAVRDNMAYAFGIIGDTQRNPEITRKCAEGIFSQRPNFTIHLGDVVDDGFAKNQWLKDLFEPMSNLNARVPMYPVIGNHEGNSHFYYDYFSLPKPEYFYSFKYGNAEFFMIDSNKPLSPGSEQYQWLDRALGESKAKWKFTAHHHPCWSSDVDDYGDTEKGNHASRTPTWGDTNARQLIALYEKHGVDISFNGHIHTYERTWPIIGMNINLKNGVRYITSGGGGGGLEKPAPNRTWFGMHFNSVHHYCYVTIHEGTMHFKAFDTEGRLFDSFELVKP
jgi:predicted phosphodiesterase